MPKIPVVKANLTAAARKAFEFEHYLAEIVRPLGVNLAALEDDDACDTPTRPTRQWRGVAIGIVLLLALALASLAWFTGW